MFSKSTAVVANASHPKRGETKTKRGKCFFLCLCKQCKLVFLKQKLKMKIIAIIIEL
jgi:hypothetical protein